MNPKKHPNTGSVHIRTILEDFFQQQGLTENIHRHRAVVYWDSLVDQEIAAITKADHINKGQLIVKVSSSVHMHYLQLQEEAIRNGINRKLGENTIEQIRFRLMTQEDSESKC